MVIKKGIESGMTLYVEQIENSMGYEWRYERNEDGIARSIRTQVEYVQFKVYYLVSRRARTNGITCSKEQASLFKQLGMRIRITSEGGHHVIGLGVRLMRIPVADFKGEESISSFQVNPIVSEFYYKMKNRQVSGILKGDPSPQANYQNILSDYDLNDEDEEFKKGESLFVSHLIIDYWWRHRYPDFEYNPEAT